MLQLSTIELRKRPELLKHYTKIITKKNSLEVTLNGYETWTQYLVDHMSWKLYGISKKFSLYLVLLLNTH